MLPAASVIVNILFWFKIIDKTEHYHIPLSRADVQHMSVQLRRGSNTSPTRTIQDTPRQATAERFTLPSNAETENDTNSRYSSTTASNSSVSSVDFPHHGNKLEKLNLNSSKLPGGHAPLHAIDLLGDRFVPRLTTDWTGRPASYQKLVNMYYAYGYSAYLDDRNSSSRGIAVIGMARLLFQFRVECVMLNSEKQLLYLSRATVPRNHVNSHTRHKVNLSSFVAWCPLVNDTIPMYVSLNAMGVNIPDFMVEVQFPLKPAKKERMLLCLKSVYTPNTPSYSPIAVEQVVEWMELNRIVGVSHVTIYNHSIPNSWDRMLKLYVREGFVNILSMGPLRGDSFKQPRATSINDCLYQNMHLYEKMVNIDVDEVIIPKTVDNLYTMLTLVSQHASQPIEGTHYKFSNNVFYTDYPVEEWTQPEYLKTLRHQYHVSPDWIRPKSIIDLSTCIMVTAHECSQSFGSSYLVHVFPALGASHHYKACASAREQNKPQNCSATLGSEDKFKKDDRILHFRNQLMVSIEKIQKLLV